MTKESVSYTHLDVSKRQNRGFAQLREEIANYYARRFNRSYEGKTQVLVTVGGSEAIDLAFRCIVSQGDEVILPEPSFVDVYKRQDLKEIVKPEDVPFLAQSAYDDACRPGNPRDTSVEEIAELYKSLM